MFHMVGITHDARVLAPFPQPRPKTGLHLILQVALQRDKPPPPVIITRFAIDNRHAQHIQLQPR